MSEALDALSMLAQRHGGKTAREPYTQAELHKVAAATYQAAVLARLSQVSEQEKRANAAKALFGLAEGLTYTLPKALGAGAGKALSAVGRGAAGLASPVTKMLSMPVAGANPTRAMFPTVAKGLKAAPELMARGIEGTISSAAENPGGALAALFGTHNLLEEMNRLKAMGQAAQPRGLAAGMRTR